MDIGAKIREIRKSKKISIRSMAEQAEVSASMISQIERNLCNPSLLLLRRIAEILDMPIWALLYDEEKSTASLIRKEDRQLINIDKEGRLKQAYLTPKLNTRIEENERELEIIYDEWEPGVSSGFMTHKGEEAVYVLSGKLEASIGSDVFALSEGDCLFYDPETPHQLGNNSETTVKFLTIITPATF